MKSLLSTFAVALLLLSLLVGCKQSMVINRVDYSQSIESVLSPNDDGIVEDVQHGLKFNIKPLQYLETQDSSTVTVEEVRYIRGHQGYYFITAPDFKNVYVMKPDRGSLKLENTLKVSENGLKQPALNQRDSYVQLLNRESGESWRLHPDGIENSESKMANREEE